MRELTESELRRFETNADEIAAEVYDEYEGPESEWPCPCCGGEGEIRLKSERVEKRRRVRLARYVKKANRDYSCLETAIGQGSELDSFRSKVCKRPVYKRTEQQIDRIVAWRKSRYDKHEELRDAVSACRASCPVCVECASIDEDWIGKLDSAVESVRQWSEDYISSQDYGDDYAYLVSESARTNEIQSWFDVQSFPIRWSDLPASLREDIEEQILSDYRAEYVDGYHSSFDLTLYSFPIGGTEEQRSLAGFREEHDLQDCPVRLIRDRRELNYHERWDEVIIYTNHDPAHWTYGLNDDEAASIILELVRDYDGSGLKRRERQELIEECETLDGQVIDIDNSRLAEVFVCYADSIRGGNCRPGTLAYMSAHNLSGHIRADLMPERNLREVKKAIRAAIQRHDEELAQGLSELTYHAQGVDP